MKNKIIRKILKEEITEKLLTFVKNLAEKRDDLDWRDIRKYLRDDMGFSDEESMMLILKTITAEDTPWTEDPFEIFYFHDWHTAFGSDMLEIFKENGVEISIDFSDTFKVGDKVFLKTDDWCDFKDLFAYDDDTYMFKKLYCEEDFFELYDYNPTFDESWDSLNQKCIDHIKDYLKEKFLNKKVTPEDSDDFEEYLDEVPEEYEGDMTITLTPEMIDRLDKDKKLEELIGTSDELNDVKYEITWSLSSAYNNSAQSEIGGKLLNEVKDIFGNGEWKSKSITKNGKNVEVQDLVFDITSIFDQYVSNYISSRGDNPADEYTYFLEVVKEVLDDSGDLLKSGINYDYFHPDVDGNDMYEELIGRF
jgi:hypothetical protein